MTSWIFFCDTLVFSACGYTHVRVATFLLISPQMEARHKSQAIKYLKIFMPAKKLSTRAVGPLLMITHNDNHLYSLLLHLSRLPTTSSRVADPPSVG